MGWESMSGRKTGLSSCEGFGRVADEVTRQRIENRVDAAIHDFGQQPAQRQAREQAIGEGCKRIAACRIGRIAKVADEQRELAVARWRRRQAVEQKGESL